MRYSREESPIHSITIPDHRQLRIGTLRSVIGDVAEKLGYTPSELVDKLF